MLQLARVAPAVAPAAGVGATATHLTRPTAAVADAALPCVGQFRAAVVHAPLLGLVSAVSGAERTDTRVSMATLKGTLPLAAVPSAKMPSIHLVGTASGGTAHGAMAVKDAFERARLGWVGTLVETTQAVAHLGESEVCFAVKK
ncbi:Aste57867_17427 [Aphanomyces stellatus]|uniref:Aste57867_17427 protein n=1 Tax=Aphanomyces stellatus TaxID=120398 RepID=A0A485L912_9STRA|nr:hypothetical protein As57867_017367 [Aphanomyces stellatus]VFT94183.1 Aste57867_17427 [Aphanomyces stellatus]